MAEVFKSVSARGLPEFNAGFETIYTVPSGKTAVILLAQVANTQSTQVGVQLRWLDSSAGSDAWTMLADGVQVGAASALNALAGKLVLESGDVLQAAQEGETPAAALDISVSLVEIG